MSGVGGKNNPDIAPAPKKNSRHIITVNEVTAKGFGVGDLNAVVNARTGQNGNHQDRFAVFIDGALPGDVVDVLLIKVKKTYGYGKIMQIITPSPFRIKSPCAVSEKCGGCQWQHCEYSAQLGFKKQIVENALARIGGVKNPPVSDVVGMESLSDGACHTGISSPFRYRNKAVFPVVPSTTSTNGVVPKEKQNKNVAKCDKFISGAFTIGMYAPRSHNIVEVSDCLIQHEAHIEILAIVKEYMRENGVTAYDEVAHAGTMRHIMVRTSLATGEVMVVLVINDAKSTKTKFKVAKKYAPPTRPAAHATVVSTTQPLATAVSSSAAMPSATDMSSATTVPALSVLPVVDRLVKKFTACGVSTVLVNKNSSKGNVILSDDFQVLSGTGFIREKIGEVFYEISAPSFFQINPVQTLTLYDIAMRQAALDGTQVVIDAHAGAGGVALFAAKHAKCVLGVDIVAAAVADAQKNAALNGITNAEFICGAAEEIIPRLMSPGGENFGEKFARPHVVFLDPPRKGCDAALLEALITARVEKIVYISCDPATLARDVKILTAGGYTLAEARPVDMFPFTGKVEVSALLQLRQQSKLA